MRDSILLLVSIGIILIKLGQGFDSRIKAVFLEHRKTTILLATLASVVLVPILFLLLILIFQPEQQVVYALIVMAVAPAADLSISEIKILGGNIKLAESVLFFSALASIVTTPIWLELYKRILGLHVALQFSHLVREVGFAQFLPITIGLGLQKIIPKNTWFGKFSIRTGRFLLIICFIILIILDLPYFTTFNLYAYAVVIVAIVSA
ncbi:MAG: hypothetical protein WBE18_04135, partial [Gammaproteobacteria bacterium]